MSENALEIVVGANGHIFVGPTEADGGTMPTNSSDALTDPWQELGFATEDGATITDARTVNNIMAWQSFYPLRRVVTERDFTVAFVLEQWNGATVPFAFGGGTLTPLGGGEYEFEPPDPEVLDERALVLEYLDGTKAYRWVVPRGLVIDNVSTQVVRANSANLPITFGATPATGSKAYKFFSNDPAMADLATGS